ncbi:VTT domain-containing protein [Tardiphaga sp. P9-11]|uniref:TVP38/TMEM64 family protein n=1 Tax=Tardiphaga sp. P9-11 TaxID=2024614 RepID=UPI0011F40206|nr:VTT domain-containing protein [Tardiphaga sp. P9-11]KAA0073042.1 TVP38/TMEM64 family protein [Tardiphaga sp. P9-11]
MSSERIVQWLESCGQLDLPAAGMLAALIVMASFVPVPRTFIVLGAGAAFGLRSLVIIVPVATAASVLAFMLSRSVLRGWVERQTAKRAAWRLIAQAVDDEGWRIVALMRFGGPLPNSAQSYLFGLTNIGLLPFALITFVFTLPQIVLYAYLGASGRALLLDDGPMPLNRMLIAMALVTALVILLLVSRRIRMILARKTGIAACGAVSG